MVEYREEFLDEIKKLLSYLVEFFKDGSIILKKYLKDCPVGGPNRQLVIMITNDENMFLANDSWKRI